MRWRPTWPPAVAAPARFVDMNGMVDWDLAVSIGARVAGDGPEVTSDQAATAVAELRADADRSTGLVREFTGLVAEDNTAPVMVVDRQGWVQANADGFAKVIEPMIDKLTAKKGEPSGLSRAVGSRVTGAEVGLLLGFLGSKVLGQFDPFHEPSGRLLLVAPNIVHVERELAVDPEDFRLWVCLHEETHRVQFTAVPWMRDHLFAEMMSLTDSIEPTRFAEDTVRRVAESLRGGGGSLMEAMSTPEQREVLDRITGMMSLLEGHADVVMDGVGPQVIPTVATIRQRFTKRRKGTGSLDVLLRRLLGLDVKMRQYAEGSRFVTAVVQQVGMDGFNRVWESPASLPTMAEIAAPATWVARVSDSTTG